MKVNERAFGNSGVDFHFSLLALGSAEFRRLPLECLDFVFEVSDMFAEGSLHF